MTGEGSRFRTLDLSSGMDDIKYHHERRLQVRRAAEQTTPDSTPGLTPASTPASTPAPIKDGYSRRYSMGGQMMDQLGMLYAGFVDIE
jgi:hypothetical protein